MTFRVGNLAASRAAEQLADLLGDELVGGDLLGDGTGDHDRPLATAMTGTCCELSGISAPWCGRGLKPYF
jgi:hypothetical protein